MTNKVKVNIEKGSEIRLLDPMRPEEVGATMKDQKTHSTSGPDGISVRRLEEGWSSGSDPDLFLLVDSRADTYWTKRCRTTLIPKMKDRTEEVGN